MHADVGTRAAQCLLKVHFCSFQWLPNYFFCLSAAGVGHQAWKICRLNWIIWLLLISCDEEMPYLQFKSKWERLFSFVSVLWALLFNIKAALCKVAHKWLIKSVFTACKVHQDFTLPCLGRFVFVFAIWGLRTAHGFSFWVHYKWYCGQTSFPVNSDGSCWSIGKRRKSSTAPSSASGWGIHPRLCHTAWKAPEQPSKLLGSPDSKMSSSYSCECRQQKYQFYPWVLPLPPFPSVLSSLMLHRIFFLFIVWFCVFLLLCMN